MLRHVRHTCKLSNADEGSVRVMQAQFAEMRTAQTLAATQLTQLMALMMRQQSSEPEHKTAPQQPNVQIGNVQINNAPAVVNNNFVIQGLMPWDGPQRLLISVTDVLEAFASNPRIIEYSKLPDHEMTNPANVPLAAELFTELAIRAHKSQDSRNIYLDPNRADQAVVYLEVGNWAVTPLVDAIRHIFDAVANMLHKIVVSDIERVKFPPEPQNAMSYAEMMYRDEPLAYVKAAKAPMVAHLINCRAGRVPALRVR